MRLLRRAWQHLARICPRILPLTILAMAALLTVKAVDLTLACLPSGSGRSIAQAGAAMFAAAHAASPEAGKPAEEKSAAEKPAEKPSEKTSGEPAKAAEAGKPGGADTAVAPGATTGSAARPIGEVAAQLGPGMSDSERALLTDLRTRRQELDKREAALQERASMLAAAESRLAARLDEMKDLQVRLEASEKARQAQSDANWRGLVKVYEDMRPRDAAAICNDLDYDVLIPVLDRMKDAKAATLLAAMDPTRAREATALLAKRRNQTTALPPPSAKAASAPVSAQPVNPPAGQAVSPPANPPGSGGAAAAGSRQGAAAAPATLFQRKG